MPRNLYKISINNRNNFQTPVIGNIQLSRYCKRFLIRRRLPLHIFSAGKLKTFN